VWTTSIRLVLPTHCFANKLIFSGVEIEMLLKTEDTLPFRVRRGFKFDKVVEFPNRKVKLRTKVSLNNNL